MNILCVDQYGDFGGAQKTFVELLPSFSERGWRVVAALPEGPVAQAIRTSGHAVHPVGAGSYSKVQKTVSDMFRYVCRWPSLVRTLTKIACAQKIGLIYVNGPRVLPAAACVARLCRVPLLFHCHNRLHQRCAVELAGRSLRTARAQVVACCRYVTEPLVSYLPPNHLHVLYNGINASSPMPTRRLGKVSRLGVVGRIETEKGQLEFVTAARILQKRFPELEFNLIGAPLFSDDSYLEAVRKAAEGLPIHFLGWQDNMQEVFASLDLLVVPSTSLDATPRVVIESLAAGLPVVAFAVGGIPEIIRDTETGFLVLDRTAEALAAKLSSVLRLDVDALTTIQNQARQSAQENYCLKKYQHAVCDLMEQTGMAA